MERLHIRPPSLAALFGALAALAVPLLAMPLAFCNEPESPVASTRTADGTAPHFTAGQGSTPTTYGQGTYVGPVAVTRNEDQWKASLDAPDGLEVVVRSFAYDPGSYTGWHKHPGPVLIQVVKGTVTFFEADAPCRPVVVKAGQGYLDTGEHGHIGRNLTAEPAQDVTVYLAPPGTQVSQLRIDMPEPPGAAQCFWH